MEKFYTTFYIDGEYCGFAICTIDGAKAHLKDNPRITSCEGHTEDEWFTWSVEKGWEHFYEVDTNDGEIADEDWEEFDDVSEVGYNPYIGGYDMDC